MLPETIPPPAYLCTADAEIKVPSAEDPELSKVLSFTPGLGQKIVLRASPTARNYAFLIFAFSFHSTSFFSFKLSSAHDVCGMYSNSESDFILCFNCVFPFEFLSLNSYRANTLKSVVKYSETGSVYLLEICLKRKRTRKMYSPIEDKHILFTYFLQLYCPKGISPREHCCCLPRRKPAATESPYPTYNACWMF